MDEHNKLDVFVELDAIMDTRLPLLYFLDKELAGDLCENNNYFTRITDSFSYLTRNIFVNLYKDRNKTLLRLATPTPILTLLKEYYLEVSANNKILGGNGIVTVYLNIYPYDLNNSEIELLEKGLYLTIGNIKIKVVSMKIGEITPLWISENINMMMMYSGMEWIEYHTATLDLIKTPLVDVAMITPSLILAEEIVVKDISNKDTLFLDIEEKLKSMIQLRFIPARDFSSMN